MKSLSRLIITISIVVFIQYANAASYQSHSSIRQAVESYLLEELTDNGNEVAVKMGKLDPRLRLKQCGGPIHVSLPGNSRRIGAVTVKVTCDVGASWAIYVQSEVEQFGQVMIAAKTLRRKDIISRGDIAQKRVSLGGIRGGYITKFEEILGWEVKRNIPVGAIIGANAVRRQLLVKRGELVVIIAKNAKFEVKMSGVAKSSGAKGDTVQVTNQSSKKVVEGVVIAPGVVQVPM